jgi:hypothetical protein
MESCHAFEEVAISHGRGTVERGQRDSNKTALSWVLSRGDPGEFRFRLIQNRNILVCISPEGEEPLILLARFGKGSRNGQGSCKLRMG